MNDVTATNLSDEEAPAQMLDDESDFPRDFKTFSSGPDPASSSPAPDYSAPRQNFAPVRDEDLPKSELLSVTIRNPEKRGDGISSFVVYTIESVRQDEKENGAVERRFSDFVWLRDQLRKERRGIIIPPLPEKGKYGMELSIDPRSFLEPRSFGLKSTFGRFSVDFIKKRQRGLERFLTQIVEHEELKSCRALQVFLSSHQAGIKLAKSSPQKKSSAGSAKKWVGNFIKQSFMAANSSISETMGLKKSREKTEEDKKIDELTDESKTKTSIMSSLSEAIAEHTKKESQYSQSWFNVGVACQALSKTERDKELMELLGNLGKSMENVSGVTIRKAQEDSLALAEPILELKRTGNSIESALKDRKTALLKSETAKETLGSRKAAETKVRSQGPASEMKLADYQSSVQKAEDDFVTADQELKEITKRVIGEYARFSKKREADLKKLLKTFVTRQIDHHQRLAEEWEKLSEQIE